jgi:hypothetical protein
MDQKTNGFDFNAWGPGIEQSLKDEFFADTNWPVAKVVLAALTDLGMSEATIAEYFGVPPAEVDSLKEAYRL